jgi:hypothetical protein
VDIIATQGEVSEAFAGSIDTKSIAFIMKVGYFGIECNTSYTTRVLHLLLENQIYVFHTSFAGKQQ